MASWTPPPALPRRILQYDILPQSSYAHTTFSLTTSAENMSSASSQNNIIETGRSSRPLRATYSSTNDSSSVTGISRFQHAHPLPSSQQQGNSQSSIGADHAYLHTFCFYDHLRQFAMMVFIGGADPLMSLPSTHFAKPTDYLSNPPNTGIPVTPTSYRPMSRPEDFKNRVMEITIQLYLYSHDSPFRTHHGRQSVDSFCRQLESSTALRHLRGRLQERSGLPGTPLPIRIEAYASTANYDSVIAHSINEQEFRGLKECRDHRVGFLQYISRLKSAPDFVTTKDLAIQERKALEEKVFLQTQMEDIRDGGGRDNRARRAMHRAELGPPLEHQNGAEKDLDGDTADSSLLANQSAPSDVAQQRARQRSAKHESRQAATYSFEPSGQLLHGGPFGPMSTQRNDPLQSSRLAIPAPGVLPRRRKQRPRRFNVHSDSSRLNPMAPPPKPSQGGFHHHPRISPTTTPLIGSAGNPFDSNPFPLKLRSIYRGVSQPYHHFALIIDHPDWTDPAVGLSMLKFGYESDWANRDCIRRPGACLERVSMTRNINSATWKSTTTATAAVSTRPLKWLGDALVEALVVPGLVDVGPSPGSSSATSIAMTAPEKQQQRQQQQHSTDDPEASDRRLLNVTNNKCEGGIGSSSGSGSGSDHHGLETDILKQWQQGGGGGAGEDPPAPEPNSKLEQMSEQMAELVKHVTVPGADQVDFVSCDWGMLF